MCEPVEKIFLVFKSDLISQHLLKPSHSQKLLLEKTLVRQKGNHGVEKFAIKSEYWMQSIYIVKCNLFVMGWSLKYLIASNNPG